MMMTSRVVNLDYAAATPMDPHALECMLPYFTEFYYNPSSPYLPALEVKRKYQESKEVIAHSIGASADELIMTAGATESINIAIHSAGEVVACSRIEHDSVFKSAQAYGQVQEIKPSTDGRITSEAVRATINDDTTLVSVAIANHELGTVQPLAEIAQVVKDVRMDRKSRGIEKEILFHSDASQGLSLLDINVARLGLDLLTLNAGKVYGPKQVGLLWVKPGVIVRPLLAGGGQEGGIRSGTENVAGVIGFAEALRLAVKRRKQDLERARNNVSILKEIISDNVPSAEFLAPKKSALANFLHVVFPGVDAERIVFMLEAKGVYVATGSACAANKGTGSKVLKAIGATEAQINGSLRLSVGRATTEDDVRYAGEAIVEAVKTEIARVEQQ